MRPSADSVSSSGAAIALMVKSLRARSRAGPSGAAMRSMVEWALKTIRAAPLSRLRRTNLPSTASASNAATSSRLAGFVSTARSMSSVFLSSRASRTMPPTRYAGRSLALKKSRTSNTTGESRAPCTCVGISFTALWVIALRPLGILRPLGPVLRVPLRWDIQTGARG